MLDLVPPTVCYTNTLCVTFSVVVDTAVSDFADLTMKEVCLPAAQNNVIAFEEVYKRQRTLRDANETFDKHQLLTGKPPRGRHPRQLMSEKQVQTR